AGAACAISLARLCRPARAVVVQHATKANDEYVGGRRSPHPAQAGPSRTRLWSPARSVIVQDDPRPSGGVGADGEDVGGRRAPDGIQIGRASARVSGPPHPVVMEDRAAAAHDEYVGGGAAPNPPQ